MKIWVIGRGYPTTSNKMWGSFELEQAKLLARNGHDVTYIALTLSFFSRKDPRGMRCFDDSGVKVFAYSHLYFPGKLGLYFEGFEDKCWRKLFDAAEKKTGLPDLIHIHYPTMISSVNEIERMRRKGIKIFVTEHWTRVLLKKLKKHEISRLKYYTSKSNCFFAVGKNLVDAIRTSVNVSVPMEIMPNMFSPKFVPSNKKHNGFVFVASGRMEPHKRFDIIIRQFIKTFGNNKNVKLKLIGTGTEIEKLKKLSENNDQIIFTGILKLDSVAKEVSMSHSLICYSSCETFAVPVIEAWACGLPIITLDTIPVSMYCDDTRGIIINDKDHNNLGKAMKKLFDQYDKYKADNIAAYAYEQFGDEALYNKLVSAYNKYA